MIFLKNYKKRAFTLVELMFVVAIIIILALVILASINTSRKNARVNGVKTTMKGVMTSLVACGISNGTPTTPPNSANDICNNVAGVKWPTLPTGYTWVAAGIYSYSCNFSISTNGDTAANLICNCQKQKCT